MIVRLIVSINRSESIEKATNTLNVTKKLLNNPKYKKYIVGLDYSGNPYKNIFNDFLHLFQDAK